MALSPDLLHRLGLEADELWRRHKQRQGGRFHGFVPADLAGAHAALATLRHSADSFVELGSGVGTITIVADLLGYDATGIEIEPWLVSAAEELAERFESDASFVEGSFLPDGFRVDELIDADFHVTYDAAGSAWNVLDTDLADFDIVYAFPWPGEEELFLELLRRHGRRGQSFLAYHADEGFVLRRDGRVVDR